MEFSCTQTASGVAVHIGKHQGTYRPWWKQIHLEVYGWERDRGTATLDKVDGPAVTLDEQRHMISLDVPDDGKGSDVDIQY